ncbi:predicted protein [Plenodomus lingam JN3]|uniref:Predicted protein n=1 Tax=Leptosphaeria maculans (strain JN3 / isolate v23.1.3 / race Av1-4-5-6-7-8) TaxID=985895 RepID=E4ZMH2_LEPMJ|nr:predicted protein [Plenodomus lingam JN3]CBX92841.1 predicted protein [Plenodomus lingam JN3]
MEPPSPFDPVRVMNHLQTMWSTAVPLVGHSLAIGIGGCIRLHWTATAITTATYCSCSRHGRR